MAEQPLKLWGCGMRVVKVQLVAAFAGMPLEQVANFTFGTTNRTAQFLALNDLGKVNATSGFRRVVIRKADKL